MESHFPLLKLRSMFLQVQGDEWMSVHQQVSSADHPSFSFDTRYSPFHFLSHPIRDTTLPEKLAYGQIGKWDETQT